MLDSNAVKLDKLEVDQSWKINFDQSCQVTDNFDQISKI